MIRLKQLLLLTLAIGLSGCGSGELSGVLGEITVDGVPVETGTISLKPAANPTGRGYGGVLNAGKFELGGNQTLSPGKYLAYVQALKATGRMSNHPQKGQVPEMQPLDVVDSPQEIEITGENAHALQLAFTTKKK